MPYDSEQQRKFFHMCMSESGRKKAKGKCPPEKVLKEYKHADSGKQKK